jgi:hypothetical protein
VVIEASITRPCSFCINDLILGVHNCAGGKGNVKSSGLGFFVVLLMLVGIPAYGYGDPSGGTLFQVLLPALAAVWGIWMIFVGHLRRYLASVIERFRGVERDKSA